MTPATQPDDQVRDANSIPCVPGFLHDTAVGPHGSSSDRQTTAWW
ncbi:hypothetical protein ACG2OD_09320 [Streptomyces sp. PDY-4]